MVTRCTCNASRKYPDVDPTRMLNRSRCRTHPDVEPAMTRSRSPEPFLSPAGPTGRPTSRKRDSASCYLWAGSGAHCRNTIAKYRHSVSTQACETLHRPETDRSAGGELTPTRAQTERSPVQTWPPSTGTGLFCW
ncbi:hypothetical protein Bbelb_428910 [Branchiostoma belcheri]|nr:hypothetical protein Bbelb_428910 [Branchiostoma belcheri]